MNSRTLWILKIVDAASPKRNTWKEKEHLCQFTLFTGPWVIVRHDGPFVVKEKGEVVA